MNIPMRYLRVVGADLQGDRRWLMLGMVERGAWISLAIIASTTGGSITDRDTAELLLRREGTVDPEAILDRLIAAGFVAVDSDRLTFPVGVDWIARPPSAEPERVNERVRRHRSTHKETTPAVTETTRNEAVTTKGEERRKEEEEAPVTAPTILSNPFILYRDLTGVSLPVRAEAWLNDYIRGHGAERVSTAMRTAWAAEPAAEGFLERLRPLLNGAAVKRHGPPIDLDSPENRRLRGEES